MTDLKEVAQLASEEFLRDGVRVFEVPAKQLFEHDDQGTLIVLRAAASNRRELARMALEFEGCQFDSSGVSLRKSLTLHGDSSLLYSTGCKVVCAIKVEAGRPRMIGFALVMSLRAQVLESSVVRALEKRFGELPRKALYLELICAEKSTGGGSLLLLRLLSKLSTASCADGIVAQTVNNGSKKLFKKHRYEALTPNVFHLTKATAVNHLDTYKTQILSTTTVTRALCTRNGATANTSRRTFWDCR